jgi:prefoldin alpha subunit
LQDTAVKKQDASQRLEQGKAQINQMMQSMQQPPNPPPTSG